MSFEEKILLFAFYAIWGLIIFGLGITMLGILAAIFGSLLMGCS